MCFCHLLIFISLLVTMITLILAHVKKFPPRLFCGHTRLFVLLTFINTRVNVVDGNTSSCKIIALCCVHKVKFDQLISWRRVTNKRTIIPNVTSAENVDNNIIAQSSFVQYSYNIAKTMKSVQIRRHPWCVNKSKMYTKKIHSENLVWP